ncbi:conserved hypothetical protein [Parafrankia sp. EAN1pec]|uniref:hypothetical protein n=1 Tax=Parafrankia sp. (strain EAN1pec) TaxID=298653 RepID=UPI0000540497|nr:conserved hypothetical protein [Frankia sp. EAN1pec]
MLWFVLTSFVLGMLAAVAARAVLPGRRPLMLGTASVLGVLGALLGGAVGQVVFARPVGAEPASRTVVGSLLGALLVITIGWGVRAHRYHSGPRRAGSQRPKPERVGPRR